LNHDREWEIGDGSITYPCVPDQGIERGSAADGLLRGQLQYYRADHAAPPRRLCGAIRELHRPITAALLVGKAVLVANELPFLRRFDRAPLIQPILFKTVVYFVVVFLVRILERIVEYLLSGGTMAGISEYVSGNFSWHRFAAVQIWIFVLFLIYTTASELNTLFGDGELYKIFFTRRSSKLKLTRRQRIRTLVKVSRLTEAHTVDELRDQNSAAHTELLGLIGGLAMR
jgi:hypothetical protein